MWWGKWFLLAGIAWAFLGTVFWLVEPGQLVYSPFKRGYVDFFLSIVGRGLLIHTWYLWLSETRHAGDVRDYMYSTGYCKSPT